MAIPTPVKEKRPSIRLVMLKQAATSQQIWSVIILAVSGIYSTTDIKDYVATCGITKSLLEVTHVGDVILVEASLQFFSIPEMKNVMMLHRLLCRKRFKFGLDTLKQFPQACAHWTVGCDRPLWSWHHSTSASCKQFCVTSTVPKSKLLCYRNSIIPKQTWCHNATACHMQH